MQLRIFSVSDVTWNPVTGYTPSAGSVQTYVADTPLSIGSPQEIIDKTLTLQKGFGDYHRQLWIVDAMGLPVMIALAQVELLGTEVMPVLRKEMEAQRAPGATDAPTYASLIAAKHREPEPRQPLPNANRGDNVTGTSPHHHSDPTFAARLPGID